MPGDTSISQQHFRALLASIRAERGESLSEFGRTLARTIDPDAHPFDRSYISKLESGVKPITPRIARALEILGAMLDGVSEIQARARRTEVWAVHDLPSNTIVLGRPRKCALPGCQTVFVPSAPNQKYCSIECRREMARRRREKRRRG